MTTSIRELIQKYKSQNIAMKLVIILAAIFVVLRLTFFVLHLFNKENDIFYSGFNYLTCPAELSLLITKPWTILTYMFLHFDILHVVFNLLFLFWFGKIFLEYLGGRNFLSVFILGGLAGAVLFIFSYNLFPAFADYVSDSNLIGASAGIYAIIIAIAVFIPNYTFPLLLIGPVKVKYIAAAMVFISIIMIPFSNAGGNIAHVGGAIFGYYYALQHKKGNDIAGWLTNWLDKIVVLFSGSGTRMKTVHKKPKKDSDFVAQKASKQEEIDKILDKISKSGYGSLSEAEKQILFDASKK
ncbi:MAG: rhomboid family intramembrane serine protease [Bacteroidia bacterium]|nr:rhomboid family intramembrane serine protease [Bacteroidia bacterium]